MRAVPRPSQGADCVAVMFAQARMGVVLTFGEHVDTPLCGGRGGLLPPKSTTDKGKAHSLKQANAKAFPRKASADILIHRL